MCQWVIVIVNFTIFIVKGSLSGAWRKRRNEGEESKVGDNMIR